MISILLFVAILGYLSVILESPIRINKTITALLTGTICWVVIAIFSNNDQHLVTEKLMVYFGEISGLLIFLMGAMTIVGRLRSAITLAIVNVLPDPVTPNSV